MEVSTLHQKAQPGSLSWLPLGLELPVGLAGKKSASNVGDTGDVGRILGLGRCPEGGNDNSLQFQYFCLENLMDRGAWPAIVHGVTKKAQEALQGQSQQKGHLGNLAFSSPPLYPGDTQLLSSCGKSSGGPAAWQLCTRSGQIRQWRDREARGRQGACATLGEDSVT